MFEPTTGLADVVLQAAGDGALLSAEGAAAIGVGLAAIGTGIAQRGIGAAAVGAIAEDREMFALGLLFTALPETLIIIAFVVIFLV